MKFALKGRLGLSRAFLFLAVLFVFPQVSNADLDARALLAKHSVAMANLNYKGILTYEHGAHLATVELSHTVIDGVEHERLVHLNGEHRSIVRDSEPGQCPHAGERLLRGLGRVDNDTDIESYYHISVVGQERVAGRLVTLIQVMPRDQHRYGYVIGLDQATHLALKVMLIGPGARVLERFQFATVEIAESNGDEIKVDAVCGSVDEGYASLWDAQWLPPGFQLAGSRQLSPEREMLMFTDGLAAFSVFVDTVASPSVIEGRAQRGATVAYMGRAEQGDQHYRVTVVGEVPSPTLERVVMSLRNNMANVEAES